ncbi:MAG TPA: hypothetical protein DEP18_04070 [Flavobacteriales bacterium]|nr:hypothetical protein [Flavobacteriales bacterium]HCA82940.1 hypothetical protein [Flavobacteriales bacterium]HRE73861.1 gliding motility-associated C-terminal domain-containing protein [Flavobacteriales bacterium]HRJ34518.1 gliding motility-associated C-terminal domain-containing protein [Flavobacteriales bacterium]HRJ39743.1 gliding motility-associated C-terminal domain-containing protein [Flavobacteriales bacterium]
MKRLLLLPIFLLLALSGYATHNRAGEITYQWLGGLKYRFIIKICTNEGSSVADRPELEIWYGDGDRDTVPRLSETPVPSIGSFVGSENIYIAEHTYDGPSTYFIEVLDPNRNQGILNISQSVNVTFCIRSVLVISPFLSTGNNSCVPQDFPCPEIGCVGGRYCFNSAAYDPDGDSLSYELIPCSGGNSNDNGCSPLAGGVYTYPHLVGGGTISLDPLTGTFCWDGPQLQGEYNIAIRINEWRNGFFMGSVVRDIQITILGICNNDPPTLTPITDRCVVAGSNINFSMTASDPNINQSIVIENYGQPFSFTNSPATFSTSGSNPKTGTFNWNTNCSHIRNSAYQIYFIARDNHPTVPMIDVRSGTIKVVPPPVTGLVAAPFANTMVLTWNPNSCANIQGYRIYRKNGHGTPNTSTCCDMNTATQLGYTLIGTTTGVNATTFTDANGLVLGNEYCYVIVAFMLDGAVSCPSNEVCDQLNMDVPVITHVSVGSTNAITGVDTVRWVHPLELDTVSNFPGPYFYKVYQSIGFGAANTLITTTPQSAQLHLAQKQVLVNNLNTVNNAYSYKVELYQFNTSNSTETLIGPTNNASSIFLTITPADQQLQLRWQLNVPWENTLYEIQRESFPGSGVFNTIATTDTTLFTDTGLVNGLTYCYRIRSTGSYSDPRIPAPLINYSQEVCASPVDLTPPCPPVIVLHNDCEIPLNSLVWNNPNNSCADDVMSYNLYFTPVEGEDFILLATFSSNTDTVFSHILSNGSVAGCYYVTAVDSVQYGNESLPSNVVCGDNCPIYFLPNVFSPNGDGDNDFFKAFPYRFIEKIDLKIFNRWGQLLFLSEDPGFRWDGKSMENGKDVPEGVYFYTCTVYTIRLSGMEEIKLNGFIHLYRENGASSQ